MLTHFNHLSQLTFLFIEAGILFLLLSELRGGVEELLEVLRITSVLEKVNLGQELLLLLLKLSNLLLQFGWVHALLSQGLSVRMDGLKLSLQVLVNLEDVSHILVVHILIWNLERHKELGCVGLSGEILETTEKPVENVLKGALFSMDNVAAVVWVEITGVAQDLQKATYTLLSLLLSLLLHIDGLVRFIKMSEHTIDQLK